MAQNDVVATMNSVVALDRRRELPATIIEDVIAKGDLSALEPADRARYYIAVCESMGLNPLTKPFEYIELDKKLTLYATRVATDQLRKLHKVDLAIVGRELVDGVYVVTARATTADGRTDESIAAVPLVKEGGQWKTSNSGRNYFEGDGTFRPLPPADRANGMMKAETKAKRRVTLSCVGLGWTDESELETIRSARVVRVDHETGQMLEAGETPAIGSGETGNGGSVPKSRGATTPITEKTRKAVHAAAKMRGISHDDLHNAAVNRYGVDGMAKMTEAQAQALLEDVKKIPIPDDSNQEQPDTEDEPDGEKADLSPQEVTWLENIRKAHKIEQLDHITETITNVGLGESIAINEALDRRLQELTG